MTGITLVAFCILAISVTHAYYAAKKPKIEVFEVSENQYNKKISLNPKKLQFDLESEESDVSKMKEQMLLQDNKQVIEMTRYFLNQLKSLEDRKKRIQKEPIVLILSPNNNILSENSKQDSDDFLDETRTEKFMKPGSKVTFHIVPPKKQHKLSRKPKTLRSQTTMYEDRTMAPRHGHYYDDDK